MLPYKCWLNSHCTFAAVHISELSTSLKKKKANCNVFTLSCPIKISLRVLPSWISCLCVSFTPIPTIISSSSAQVGGERKYRQAARPSGGSVGPQRGDVVKCSASGGPEDPGKCHLAQHQLGQTEQATPGQIEVRRGREGEKRINIFQIFMCMHVTTWILTDVVHTFSVTFVCLCVHIKALAGLQLQVAEVFVGSEDAGGVAEWCWGYFETSGEWASSTQTAPQGNTYTHTHTHRDTYSDTQAFLYKYKYRFTYT